MDRNQFAKQCHEISRSKGWYDGKPRSLGELVMLMITEIAEATEEVRNKRPAIYAHSLDGSEVIESLPKIRELNLKPEGEAIELADCLIRIGDALGYLNREEDVDHLVEVELDAAKDSPWIAQLPTSAKLEDHLAICHSLVRAGTLHAPGCKGASSLCAAWAKIELIFQKNGWNLDEALDLKASYNKTRSYRHGGKAL